MPYILKQTYSFQLEVCLSMNDLFGGYQALKDQAIRFLQDGNRYYKIRWKDTWEPEEYLQGCNHLIRKFWERLEDVRFYFCISHIAQKHKKIKYKELFQTSFDFGLIARTWLFMKILSVRYHGNEGRALAKCSFIAIFS